MPGGRATSSHRGSTAGHDHTARRAAPACGTAGSCKDDSPAPPIPTARRHWTVGSIRGILLHLSGVVDIPNDHQRRPGEDQVPGPSTFVAVTHFYHNFSLIRTSGRPTHGNPQQVLIRVAILPLSAKFARILQATDTRRETSRGARAPPGTARSSRAGGDGSARRAQPRCSPRLTQLTPNASRTGGRRRQCCKKKSGSTSRRSRK